MATLVGSGTAFATDGLAYGATVTASIQSGDVIVVITGARAGGTISESSPSLTYASLATANNTIITRAFRAVATGSASSATVTIAGTGSSFASSAIIFVIRDVDSDTADIETDTATGSASAPNAPNLVPTDDGIDRFVVAAAASLINDSTPGTVTNFTNINNVTSGGAQPVSAAAVYRTPVAPTSGFEIAAWSGWASGTWAAITLAFRVTSPAQNLTASLFAPGDTLFPPTVTSIKALSPPLLTDADTLFTPTVARSGFLTPSLHIDTDVLFPPVVQLRDKFLLPPTLVDSDTFFLHFVNVIAPVIPTIPSAPIASRSIILIEMDALDEAGEPVVLRYGTDGVMTIREGIQPAVHFEPRIIDPGNFEHHLFTPNRVFGETTAGYGDIIIAAPPASRAGLSTDAVLGYSVDGREFSIYETPSKRTPRSQWTLRLRGLVDFLSTDDAYTKLGFKIRDALRPLEVELLTEEFGGTTVGGGLGTVDGDVTMTGVKKQNVYGVTNNVEAQVANPFDLVYQFTNRPCVSLTVRDAGALLTNGGDFASLASLMAWTQVAGQYVTHLASGLARLGSSPVGTVTADVRANASDDDMSAGQLVRQILDESFAFTTTTTTDNLLTSSPDAFTVVRATITGTGPEFKIVENTQGNEHLARTPNFTKEARSISYEFTGEFDFDPRSLMIRIGDTISSFAALVIPADDPDAATTVTEGGYSATSFELLQLDANWWQVTFVISTNSATTVHIDLVLVQATVSQPDIGQPPVVDFDTMYTGDGTSGVSYRNLELAARVSINSELFDQLDAKNPSVVGYLATGTETILDVCQKILNGIGAYIVPNQFGELQTGRFDFPPGIPDNTNEMLLASPEAFWSTADCTIIGNSPALIQESVSSNAFHFIRAIFMREQEKIRYRFVGEFKPSGSPARNGFQLGLGTFSAPNVLSTGVTLTFNVATGDMTYRASGAEFGLSSTIEFATIEASTDGYYLVTVEMTSDTEAAFFVSITLSTDGTNSGVFYPGNGTSGLLMRNVSLKPVNPSIGTITEDIILGDSLQRLATGDDGRGIPYWKVTGRYQKNWRPMQANEILPSVSDAERLRLGQEWLLDTPVIHTDIRNRHPTSIEHFYDSYMTTSGDAGQETTRRSELFGVLRNAYRCELPDRYAADFELGQMATLILSRFGLENGKLMTIIGRIEDLENRTTTLILWG